MVAENSAQFNSAEQLLSELHRLIVQSNHHPALIQEERNDNFQPTLLTRATRLYKGRRARTRLIDRSTDLFGEPAWDILLDLFIARETDQQVSISSACIAADVPSTTALRWIAVLEKRGLVERWADPVDLRRFYLRLSDEANTKMRQWLELWS